MKMPQELLEEKRLGDVTSRKTQLGILDATKENGGSNPQSLRLCSDHFGEICLSFAPSPISLPSCHPAVAQLQCSETSPTMIVNRRRPNSSAIRQAIARLPETAFNTTDFVPRYKY
jgi:hypothetical protein